MNIIYDQKKRPEELHSIHPALSSREHTPCHVSSLLTAFSVALLSPRVMHLAITDLKPQ